MSLPLIPLKPGVNGSSRSGKGHDDIPTLLKDLHEGVLELAGKGEVTSHDEPQRKPPTFGFDLSIEREGRFEWWEFYIALPKWVATRDSLSPKLRAALDGRTTNRGRALIARLMQDGTPPDELESKL